MLTLKYSERKWKDKVKEWNFDKNISARDMSIVVAKVGKRVRDEGKDTVILHREAQISRERIEQFKRRKITKDGMPVSPSAGTCLQCASYRYFYSNLVQKHLQISLTTPHAPITQRFHLSYRCQARKTLQREPLILPPPHLTALPVTQSSHHQFNTFLLKPHC